MLPDRVSNPGPLTYESGALPIALRGPVQEDFIDSSLRTLFTSPIGQEYPCLQMSEIFLSRPAVSA